MITGKTLIAWGYKPGAWFAAAIAAAERARLAGADAASIRALVDRFAPTPTPSPSPALLHRPGERAYRLNIRAEDDTEAENVAAVEGHMRELMRVPTVVVGAVMPDACPAGSAPGTIPVGGVVAAKNAIHPGMHSADICCSMAVSVFADADATAILDAGMKLSHFGGGGRPRGERLHPPAEVLEAFEANRFLRPLLDAAIEHFATQGDGNHFFYVGRVASSGQIALVTHHGSRKPGAMLYKAGMEAAERFRRILSPVTPKHNAWIPADTHEGESYWQALQVIRAWTKANHYAIHDRIAAALALARKDRFWNEHNFVFRRSDGLFYHAKGATPAWADFAPDSSGLTLIPLNMAEPILIARGLDAEHGLGFAPHGAGRNFSRTAYMRQHASKTEAQIVAEQTVGIDARFFCGIPDVSELPGAYKNAAAVRGQIAEFSLAEIVDTIEPIGCIMAGDWQRDAPWRKKKGARKTAA
jgi:tRNA-splicing ligase RtcB (3'-phosphate/5'-hydroxy nucleic acid ligase)